MFPYKKYSENIECNWWIMVRVIKSIFTYLLIQYTVKYEDKQTLKTEQKKGQFSNEITIKSITMSQTILGYSCIEPIAVA